MSGSCAPVFICHSSGDAQDAESLVDALEADGVRCWIAPRDVNSGDPYPRQLVRAISECRAFLLLATPHAVQSDHVLRELEQAAKAKRRLVPVVIANATSDDLDYYLGVVHQIHSESVVKAIPAVVDFFTNGMRDSANTRPTIERQSAQTQLRVGVIPFPPFSSHAAPEHGSPPGGLYVELLNRFAEATNTEVSYRAITNEQSTKLIDGGDVDLIASLYRTPRRERAYDFAGCLFAATIGAVVRSDDPRFQNQSDLLDESVRIVACQGEIGAELARDSFGALHGSSRLMEIDTTDVSHIGLMVAAGAADAAITDHITCQRIVEQIGDRVRVAFRNFPLYVGQIGLLMAEGRGGLRDHLNVELRRLRLDPEFQAHQQEVLTSYGGMLQSL